MSGSHIIPRNETVQPPYFQNRIVMFCLPIPTLIYLWEIYIFPGLVKICGPILVIYIWLRDTWMWKIEAAQFPEKEYINGIFVTVQMTVHFTHMSHVAFPWFPSVTTCVHTYVWGMTIARFNQLWRHSSVIGCGVMSVWNESQQVPPTEWYFRTVCVA